MRFGPEHQNVRNATLGVGVLLTPGETFVTAEGESISFALPAASAMGSSWTSFVLGANRNARNLQSMIDALAGQGGGTLYFPPGRYYLGRTREAERPAPPTQFTPVTPGAPVRPTTEAPDILVTSDVVLEFAPGAVLVPMNFELAPTWLRARPERDDERALVVVEVQGPIRAGLHEIFATTLYPRDDIFPYEPELRAGKVVFTGGKVREVYPEWWGALSQTTGSQSGPTDPRYYGGHWGVRNRRALQATIDAGHTDRYRLVRDDAGAPRRLEGQLQWRQEPTIPVVAMYEYYVEGELRVGLTAELAALGGGRAHVNPAPFVMKGGAEPSRGNRTFRAIEDPELRRLSGLPSAHWQRRPMLSLDGVSSFYLEGLGFDGDNFVYQIVDLRLGVRGGLGEFKRCTFMNLRNAPEATLVTISSSLRDEERAEEPVHLAFTVCRMTPIVLNYRPNGEADVPGYIVYASRVRGLLLDCDPLCSIELRACHLQGVCDPMIHARRGRFALNECVLHSNRSVQTDYPLDGSPVAWRRFWNSTSGTDIFIDRARTINGVTDAPASFTARELESQSFQFVSTWMDGDPPAERRPGPSTPGSAASYVVINAHHTAAPAGSHEDDQSQGDSTGGGADPHPLSSKQFRPSISWEGPGQTGCHLVVMGVCFKNTYLGAGGRYSDPLGGIRLGPLQTGTIFQLANTTADDLTRRGAFVTSQTAVAPASFIRWDHGTAPQGIREPEVAPFPRPPRP